MESKALNMINISTVVRFLFFDAAAIRAVARSPMATWLGLLFVVSAGFAREYDGEYLLAEPWHVLIPIAASVIGCVFMVVFLYGLAFRHVNVGFLKTLRSFMNVYWMTAPMAWLYAIPFEQFCEPGDATRANLWMLGLVAVWRVALMVRCVQVIYKSSTWWALVPVILFSDILAMVALGLVPGPIFLIMGGVRLSESESLILGFRLCLRLAGYLSMPIWIIAYLVGLFTKLSWRWTPSDAGDADSVGWSAWGLAIASLLVWIPILPFTQPQQGLRWKSEALIQAEDFEAFAKLTRDYPEIDFPRHWDPPPRIAYQESEPSPVAAVIALHEHGAAQWAIEHYMRKIKDWRFFRGPLSESSDEELASLVKALELLPEVQAQSVVDGMRYEIERMVEGRESDEPPQISEARQALVKKLVSMMKADQPADAILDASN